MKSIYRSCVGESHISSGKPCQDCSYAYHSDDFSMAIVSDGHGGERYFRSQLGSEFVVAITRKAVTTFVETLRSEGNPLLKGEPFTDYIASDENAEINTNAHRRLTWLFSSIISQWNQKIEDHARNNALTDWEKQHVEQKYQDEFISAQQSPDASFEKTYGCTLMAYVQTPDYWFAFQLGDGKLITMEKCSDLLVCKQPVPWDERCFLNKTTSICDSHALEEFRYCYQGDGIFPIAAFLGSDGLDDTYGDGDKLNNFYIELYKQIAKSGLPTAENVLKRSLPMISKIGSKDDMSVAAVFDDNDIDMTFYCLVNYQIAMIDKEKSEVESRKKVVEEKIALLSASVSLDKNESINLDYAIKDCKKINTALKKNYDRKLKFLDEIIRFDNARKSVKKPKKEKSKTLADKKFRNRDHSQSIDTTVKE